MKTLITITAVLGIAAAAFAQTSDKTKTTTKTTSKTTTTTTTTSTGSGSGSASSSTASAAMTMPDPDAALLAMAKTMKGTWSCTGTETGMDGTAMPVKGTMKFTLDLDKMWLRGDFTGAKAKGMKRAYKGKQFRMVTGGAWTMISIDNMGGMGTETSTGPDATGKITWDGSMSMGGQSVKAHDYEGPGDKKGTEHVWGEISMDGSKWNPTYDMTCKP